MKMRERKPLYFVTTIGTTMISGEEQYKDSRCWGYYYDINEAVTAIVENHTDIHECTYDYAVIEGVPDGVLPIDMEELKWFQWNNVLERYEEIDEKPKSLHNIISWSVG